MGSDNPQITITTGLAPGQKKKLKRRRRKRPGKGFGRTLDQSSVVTVNRWPLVDPGLGVLAFYVSSCNVCGDQCSDPLRWTGDAISSVRKRLVNNDGEAKGRVLFVFSRDAFGHEMPVAVLAYHFPTNGTIMVLGANVALDCREQTRRLVAGLLACAEAIARKSASGRTPILKWKNSNPERVREICEAYGFTQVGKHRQEYHLRRTGKG